MKEKMSKWWKENRELVYAEAAIAVAAVLIALAVSSYKTPTKVTNKQKATMQSVDTVNQKAAATTVNFYNFVKSKTR